MMSKQSKATKSESETQTVNIDAEITAIERAKQLLAEAKAKLSPAAKAALAEKEKAEKAAKANRVTRTVASVRVIQALNGDAKKIDDLVKDADRIYAEAGGPSNLKEASFSLRRTVGIAMEFGLVVEKDGVVTKK